MPMENKLKWRVATADRQVDRQNTVSVPSNDGAVTSFWISSVIICSGASVQTALH